MDPRHEPMREEARRQAERRQHLRDDWREVVPVVRRESIDWAVENDLQPHSGQSMLVVRAYELGFQDGYGRSQFDGCVNCG